MLHPLLHLAATRPQLLAQHVEAYAELACAETGRAVAGWRRRALQSALALCGVGVAAVLAGVALMLWAVLPAEQIHAPWALLLAPALPLAVAVWSALAAQAGHDGEAFDELRRQLQADMSLLHQTMVSR